MNFSQEVKLWQTYEPYTRIQAKNLLLLFLLSLDAVPTNDTIQRSINYTVQYRVRQRNGSS